MQQPAPSQSSPTLPSFAGLLTTLVSPPPDAADSAPQWDNDDMCDMGHLREDTATLSYERALRARARYRQANRGDGPAWPAEAAAPGDAQDAAKMQASEALPARVSVAPQATFDRNLRPASVTVRLSNEESVQLRQRAAEAGLTVSAYLRSCTFEVEALRTQVKAALAELRKGREQGNKGTRERGDKAILLARVLARIGSLCIGISARRSS